MKGMAFTQSLNEMGLTCADFGLDSYDHELPVVSPQRQAGGSEGAGTPHVVRNAAKLPGTQGGRQASLPLPHSLLLDRDQGHFQCVIPTWHLWLPRAYTQSKGRGRAKSALPPCANRMAKRSTSTCFSWFFPLPSQGDRESVGPLLIPSKLYSLQHVSPNNISIHTYFFF